MDIEFARCIAYGREVREHLRTLCDSVAIIIGRYRSTQQSAADTREAFSDLRQDLSCEYECGLPERDQVFLSYSARADPAVIGELKRVLGSDKYAELGQDRSRRRSSTAFAPAVSASAISRSSIRTRGATAGASRTTLMSCSRPGCSTSCATTAAIRCTAGCPFGRVRS